MGAYEDPHAIAGALKLYFRELPIPLIPFDNYDLVLIAASKWKLHAHVYALHVLCVNKWIFYEV